MALATVFETLADPPLSRPGMPPGGVARCALIPATSSRCKLLVGALPRPERLLERVVERLLERVVERSRLCVLSLALPAEAEAETRRGVVAAVRLGEEVLLVRARSRPGIRFGSKYMLSTTQ